MLSGGGNEDLDEVKDCIFLLIQPMRKGREIPDSGLEKLSSVLSQRAYHSGQASGFAK